jgi:hypothetical protein
MIEIPNPDSVEGMADWIELMLMAEEGQLSRADVSNSIEQTVGTEASEAFISSVWRELDYRGSLYSTASFALSAHTIEAQTAARTRSDYLTCLVLSLFGVQGDAQLPGKLFERITREAVRNYVDGEAMVFGWPFDPHQGTDEPAIMRKVREMAELLSEDFYETPATGFKDRGLDVVGWCPHADKRSNQVIVLLQCAAGHNWRQKLPVPLDAWREYIHWAAIPMIGFAVPCVVGRQVWHDASKEKGLLFDRIRIMNLLEHGIEEQALRDEVDAWVQGELTKYME